MILLTTILKNSDEAKFELAMTKKLNEEDETNLEDQFNIHRIINMGFVVTKSPDIQ